MPEELCMKFIDRYLAEQENLRKEVSGLEAELRNAKDMRENIDEFMSRIKKYLDVTVLYHTNTAISTDFTRFTCLSAKCRKSNKGGI